jgi:hypothetical protein
MNDYTYTKISSTAFSEVVPDAGMLCYNFDVGNPAPPDDEDIICATTGDVTASCVPKYKDWGEDVNCCPNGMLEFLEVQSYDCKFACTAVTVNADFIALALGFADNVSNHVKPRYERKTGDGKDITFLARLADGKLLVCQMHGCVSSAGFVLKTKKTDKGTVDVELAGHPTMATMNEVPMDFYILEVNNNG